MADFTEDELDLLIKNAMDEGMPGLVKYYQGKLEELRAEKKSSD